MNKQLTTLDVVRICVLTIIAFMWFAIGCFWIGGYWVKP